MAKIREEPSFERNLARGHEFEIDACNGGDEIRYLDLCALTQGVMCHPGRIVKLINALLCEEWVHEFDTFLSEKKLEGFNAR